MESRGASGGGSFPETRWTLILASQTSPEQKCRALGDLLQTYWQPLYVYLRRKGLGPEEAADTVQGFAVRLLEKDFLSRLDPRRGRLRGYLKTALNHYLSNLREEASAEKRGGRVKIVSLDFDAAEQALGAAPPDAEKAYLRAGPGRFSSALATSDSSNGRKGPRRAFGTFKERSSILRRGCGATCHDDPQLEFPLARGPVSSSSAVWKPLDAAEVEQEWESCSQRYEQTICARCVPTETLRSALDVFSPAMDHCRLSEAPSSSGKKSVVVRWATYFARDMSASIAWWP
jgi:hypothetical protein